jgi:hypothetical protein
MSFAFNFNNLSLDFFSCDKYISRSEKLVAYHIVKVRQIKM